MNGENIKDIRHRYQHRKHNKNLLMVHLIFVTKYRKPILHGNIRNSIKQYIIEICIRYHWYVRKMETDTDHIHILLQYNPKDSITRIVSVLKQYSTYHIWKSYGQFLCGYYREEQTFWSDGYFAASIGEVSSKTVEYYIAGQGRD